MDLYRNTITYTIPFLEISLKNSNHNSISFYGSVNDSYCLLSISFNLKIISLISLHLISLFFKNVLKKRHKSQLNSQKIKQELGDLLGPKNPTKGKFILNPAFNYSRKMSWDNSKKDSKSISAKKKEKQSQQLEILLFTMLKTLDSFLYSNSLLTKSQLWIRSLPTATKCMT